MNQIVAMSSTWVIDSSWQEMGPYHGCARDVVCGLQRENKRQEYHSVMRCDDNVL